MCIRDRSNEVQPLAPNFQVHFAQEPQFLQIDELLNWSLRKQPSPSPTSNGWRKTRLNLDNRLDFLQNSNFNLFLMLVYSDLCFITVWPSSTSSPSVVWIRCDSISKMNSVYWKISMFKYKTINYFFPFLTLSLTPPSASTNRTWIGIENKLDVLETF